MHTTLNWVQYVYVLYMCVYVDHFFLSASRYGRRRHISKKNVWLQSSRYKYVWPELGWIFLLCHPFFVFLLSMTHPCTHWHTLIVAQIYIYIAVISHGWWHTATAATKQYVFAVIFRSIHAYLKKNVHLIWNNGLAPVILFGPLALFLNSCYSRRQKNIEQYCVIISVSTTWKIFWCGIRCL